MNRFPLALATLVLLAMPTTAHNGATPTAVPTSLYFHVNGFQDFAINTQAPKDPFTSNEGVGVTTNTATCVPANTVTGGFTHAKYHTYYGYLSPALVEYGMGQSNFTDGTTPHVHAERGLAADANLDTQAGITMHWFLSTFTGMGGSGADATNQVPLVVPQVIVRGTLRTGEQISIGDEGYNSGAVVAQGESKPALLAQSQTTGATYAPASDGTQVYEFTVPLAFAGNATIPMREGFNVRVDVFESVPACDSNADQSLMPNVVRPYSGPGQRPRLELAAFEPIDVVAAQAEPTPQGVVFRVDAQSIWGAYDVDAAGATIELVGPGGAYQVERLPPLFHPEEHDYQAWPADMAWRFNATALHAPKGEYTATVHFSNLRHNANVTQAVTYDLESSNASPAPVVGLLVALAVSVAIARRR